MKRVCAITASLSLVACGMLAWAQESPPVRVWTDNSGNYEVRAEFVEFKDSLVVLKRENGRVLRVSLQKLCDADQQYVREQLKTRRRTGDSSPEKADASPEKVANRAPATGEWPSWRGPRRDAVSDEKGLLSQWPKDGPRLLWRVDGLGGGYSSLSIADGIIYTMGRRDGSVDLIALNLENGREAWSLGVREGGDAPNCTPTTADGLVYALGVKGDLVCADAAGGKEVWRTNYGRDFGGKMMSGWGYSESPLVDGDLLICTPGASKAMLAALNKRTGQVVWRTAVPDPAGKKGAGYSSVVISHGGGLKQYVQLVGGGVVSVDAKTGQFLWGYDRVANGTANVPTPIVKDDYVFCSSGYGDGGSALLNIERGGRAAREVYYLPSKQTQNHHGGMILLGDNIFMGHGQNNGFPLCINMQTGQDVWRQQRGPGTGSAAILYADGHLYFRYENGVMALIEATTDGYKLKSSFRIASNNGRSWPHPVIAGGKLYLRDQQELLCYDIRQDGA